MAPTRNYPLRKKNMDRRITLEEVPANVPDINRVAWMRMVNRLLEQAEPGNAAWRRLENEFGFVGDYSEADHGMHRSDNQQNI